MLFEDVALFVHGRLGGPGLLGGVLEAVAWAAFIAVPVLCVLGLRRARTLLRDGERGASQRLLAIYWALATAAVAAAFVVSTAPEDVSAVRYMTILWPALLTLGAIAWPRRAPTALALLATATAALGSWELAEDRYAAGDPRAPQGPTVSELEDFVRDEGLDHGYAAYWDAASLTQITGYAARTYPIEVCGPGGAERCAFHLHTIDSWYEPRPEVRSYYVDSDTGLPDATGPPPASWGQPARRVRFGHLTLYVYDYDLAREIGPPPGG